VRKEAGILSRHGLSLDSAVAQLYVLDQAGCWQRGIDAFLTIRDPLPAYRWPARVVPVLGLLPHLGFTYRRFATWRYRCRCNSNCTPEKPATGASYCRQG
jgi:predicted DCC family thiol-disulfide oxidoreductase YuxK